MCLHKAIKEDNLVDQGPQPAALLLTVTSSLGSVQTLTLSYRNLAPKEYVTIGSTLKPHCT